MKRRMGLCGDGRVLWWVASRFFGRYCGSEEIEVMSFGDAQTERALWRVSCGRSGWEGSKE